MDWHYADIFEAVAGALTDEPALLHGDTEITWGGFDRRANALAADLLDAGLTESSKVAAYLYNDPAYLQTYFAAFKAGLSPFNTNYRYGADEVAYIWDNADAEAVVFHTSFVPLIERIRERLPQVKRWYAVEDDGPVPDWAASFAGTVRPGADRVEAPWGRSGEQYLMIYTGGTTGMPKGVMWSHNELAEVLGRGGNVVIGVPPAESLEEIAERASAGMRMLPACPLMHGTGQFTAFVGMAQGQAIVTMPNRSFDPAALFREIDAKAVNSVIIVGDAFARPMVEELDANRADYDLSSLLVMISSGVMWSREVKERLVAHIPQLICFDSYGSSEAVGLGQQVSTAGDAGQTARFALGERVKVFTEDGRSVQPGSGEQGFVAIGGPQPLGYYKDPEKTAKTFRTIDGVRYSIPGDYAEVDADGTLHLLGRGSVCINTGGEKVFPEEVEEVLKGHEAVEDAVCVGLPDERFGETVCAVVELADGDVPAGVLVDHVKFQLASYKAPRDVVVVDSIGRAPNGKVDYKRLADHARTVLGR